MVFKILRYAVGSQNLKRVSAAFFVLFVSVSPGAAKELFFLAGSVNINEAGLEDLEKLPFIGERRAKRIIAHREKFGFFKNPVEITSVNGISTDIFSSIRDYLAVDGKTDLSFKPYRGIRRTVVNIDSFDGPVLALDNEKYFSALSSKIAGAEKSILMSMYLFKTSSFRNNLANSLLRKLLDASKRGVKVTAVFERNNYPDESINIANRNTAKKLRKGGVKVFFDSRKRITHTKLVIVDGRFLFIGSHNLTHTALKRSNEASLMIDSSELSRYFKRYIENIPSQ